MKKLFYLISITAFVFTLYSNISVEFQPSTETITSLNAISNIAFAYPPACEDCDFVCSAGGLGSLSCSASVSGGGAGTECSVSCASPCYACCNAYVNKCKCCNQ